MERIGSIARSLEPSVVTKSYMSTAFYARINWELSSLSKSYNPGELDDSLFIRICRLDYNTERIVLYSHVSLPLDVLPSSTR